METEKEEEYHGKALLAWIEKQEDVSRGLRDYAVTYYKTKFEPYMHMLCNRHFFQRRGGYRGDNSFQESENSALKRDTLGPRPNQPIDQALAAVRQHEERRLAGLERHSTRGLSQQRSDHGLESRETYVPELSKHFNDYAVDDLNTQFVAANNYVFFFDKEHSKFYVRRFKWDHKKEKYPIYGRTRVVDIVPDGRGGEGKEAGFDTFARRPSQFKFSSSCLLLRLGSPT